MQTKIKLKVKEGRDYIENTCRNLVSGIKVAHKAAVTQYDLIFNSIYL
jgi:hypothetical protein